MHASVISMIPVGDFSLRLEWNLLQAQYIEIAVQVSLYLDDSMDSICNVMCPAAIGEWLEFEVDTSTGEEKYLSISSSSSI